MKKIIGITLLMAVLIIHGQTFSQSLMRTCWQLQNPPSRYTSEIVCFGNSNNSNFTIITTSDLTTGSSSELTGAFQQSGDNLTINFSKGRSLDFIVVWISATTIKLVTNNTVLIYAKPGSIDDTFLQRAIQGSDDYNPYYVPEEKIDTYKICYTCHGAGSCVVCRGSGTCSAYGFSSTCSACGGDGKCYHCHGSGQQ